MIGEFIGSKFDAEPRKFLTRLWNVQKPKHYLRTIPICLMDTNYLIPLLALKPQNFLELSLCHQIQLFTIHSPIKWASSLSSPLLTLCSQTLSPSHRVISLFPPILILLAIPSPLLTVSSISLFPFSPCYPSSPSHRVFSNSSSFSAMRRSVSC